MTSQAGLADLERAAAGLAARLPGPLAGLARLAYNYRWSWLDGGPELFEAVDPERWELCAANPVRLLQEASAEGLARAAGDGELLSRVAAAEQLVAAELASGDQGDQPRATTAFLCAEYAIHCSLPVYSGGLGALAGDLVKQASDDDAPLVAVGLMYRQGYFRQRLDASGWQHEYWTATDPPRVPAALVRGPDGEAISISVSIGGIEVHAQAWRVQVGRVPVFLLDADRPDNSPQARWITSRLYVSDPEVRLAQYVLLGVGGLRMLGRLGVDPSTVHLNEGHAAFATLELARAETARGHDLEESLELARRRTVFTTHTPVPAGNDTYPTEQVLCAVGGVLDELGLDRETFGRLGRSHADHGNEPFGVTQFALRSSRRANAVSRRHGGVAREMWRDLWPGRAADEIPIDHVTNGVHIPTWIGPQMRHLLDRHLGERWIDRAGDPATWEPIDAIPAGDLWAARCAQRADLVSYVQRRSPTDRLGRGDTAAYAEAAEGFDPGVLTVGFARRLATYKRLRLLIEEPANLDLLAGERPLQVIIAGKAHPRDDDAKRLLQALFGLKGNAAVAGRVVFLEDYDLDSAARLVRGCDVWVNLPRPPLEASGTSGMKSAVNGGLQLSVLDGWWAEAYDGGNGWALDGTTDADAAAQDSRTGAELHRILRDEVLPTFSAVDDAGIPAAWIELMRRSMRTLAPRFSAARMLADYREQVYCS
ncbi:MAG TPA: alpha-glucan family phosphorylase [Solirubrobacteraceae bacterium]|jgi:starch phosphorylase|nr:alpha-glucan family phosphorylase [Solirubrobacteraceae bacterium]